jgi:hypothetical protein
VRMWPIPPHPAVPDNLHDLRTWMQRLSMATPDPQERAP